MTTNSTVKDPDHTYHTETNPIPHTSHADKCPDHRTKTKITHKDPGHAQHTETKTQNTQRQRPRPHTTHRTQITHHTETKTTHITYRQGPRSHTLHADTQHTHSLPLWWERKEMVPLAWPAEYGPCSTGAISCIPWLPYLGAASSIFPLRPQPAKCQYHCYKRACVCAHC